MKYNRAEVRGAEALPPGVYWATLCVRQATGEKWYELSDAVPVRQGHPEHKIGVWLGTRDGVQRSASGVARLEREGEWNRVIYATLAERAGFHGGPDWL